MKTAGSCSDRLTSAGLQWCIENVNAFYFVSLTHFGSISNKYRHVNQLNSSVCLVDYLSAVQLRQLFCCLLRETQCNVITLQFWHYLNSTSSKRCPLMNKTVLHQQHMMQLKKIRFPVFCNRWTLTGAGNQKQEIHLIYSVNTWVIRPQIKIHICPHWAIWRNQNTFFSKHVQEAQLQCY